MRHRRFTKRIGTDSDHARANLRNLASALVKYEKIKTTVAKAKQLRPYIEKLITFGKKGDLHARRIVVSRLDNKEATKKIFDDLAKRFENRNGGYTRIVRAGRRAGDCAPMAYITFVDEEVVIKTKEKSEETKKEVETIKEQVEQELEGTAKPEKAEEAVEAKAEAETEKSVETEEVAEETTEETSEKDNDEKSEEEKSV